MSSTDVHDSTDQEATEYEFVCDDDSAGITVAVVTGVARATGVDPRDLPPLYDVVDGSELERLVDGARARGAADRLRVAFDYEGCSVAVAGDGTVTVRPDDGLGCDP